MKSTCARRRFGWASFAAVWFALIGLGPSAIACTTTTMPRAYAIDTTSPDETPPGAPSNLVVELTRGTEPASEPCSSCYGFGRLRLTFDAPMDDTTPSSDLGYRVVITSAQDPGITLPDYPLELLYITSITFWDMQDTVPVSFTAELRAVDRAGNESVGVPFSVDDPGHPILTCDSGGSTGSGGPGPGPGSGPVHDTGSQVDTGDTSGASSTDTGVEVPASGGETSGGCGCYTAGGAALGSRVAFGFGGLALVLLTGVWFVGARRSP